MFKIGYQLLNLETYGYIEGRKINRFSLTLFKESKVLYREKLTDKEKEKKLVSSKNGEK